MFLQPDPFYFHIAPFNGLAAVRSIAWLGLGVYGIEKYEQTEETDDNQQRDTQRRPPGAARCLGVSGEHVPLGLAEPKPHEPSDYERCQIIAGLHRWKEIADDEKRRCGGGRNDKVTSRKPLCADGPRIVSHENASCERRAEKRCHGDLHLGVELHGPNETKTSDGRPAPAGKLWRGSLGVNGADCQATT
jgi:hypothetical protein